MTHKTKRADTEPYWASSVIADGRRDAPGGQAQFSRVLALQANDPMFGRLHAWIADHLAADLSVTELATRAAMSERTFVRRYRAATGQSPARAVGCLRIEGAQRLLANSALSIKRIAQRCGFGSEETMRQSFQRNVALAPSEYRARFSSNGATRVMTVTPTR